jgi:dihydrodipicolinate synthase/N-acetylneuraminate lyase
MPLLSRRQALLTAIAAAAGTAWRPGRAQPLSPAMGPTRPTGLRFAVPAPTPFSPTLELDLAAHRQLLAFYRRAGATAVLAVAAGGEMLSISWPEALELSRQARQVFGTERTWASVSRGSSVQSCLAGIRELRAAGVGLPVVVPGLLAGGELSEEEALARLMAVAQGAAGPLGLYEAIAPYHRILSPKALARLSRSGAYQLLKTTQGAAAAVSALLQATGGALRIYEANSADLAEVLTAGASGVLNVSAAVFPELVAALMKGWGDPARSEQLRRLCGWIGSSDTQFQTALSFPRGIKAALALRGLPITALSRQAVADLSGDQQAAVTELVRQFRGWCRDLAVTPLV